MGRDGSHQRFCDSCAKNVHDISSMTEVQARKTLDEERRKGRVCVRYQLDQDGEILFRPETIAAPIRTMAMAAGIALAVLGSGCTDATPDLVEADHCTYEVGPFAFTLARGSGSCPDHELMGELPPLEPVDPVVVEPDPQIRPLMGDVAIEPPEPVMGQEIAAPGGDEPCDGEVKVRPEDTRPEGTKPGFAQPPPERKHPRMGKIKIPDDPDDILGDADLWD